MQIGLPAPCRTVGAAWDLCVCVRACGRMGESLRVCVRLCVCGTQWVIEPKSLSVTRELHGSLSAVNHAALETNTQLQTLWEAESARMRDGWGRKWAGAKWGKKEG